MANSSSLWLCGLIAAVGCVDCLAQTNDFFHAGPLFDRSALVLTSGYRTEALGPFFYEEQSDDERTWAVPPLFSHTRNPATDSTRFNFLYPIMTYSRFGDDYRWQFAQLLSFAGGPHDDFAQARRFTLLPIYFQQRSPISNENYTAVFPFYGHLENRLFRRDIRFVLFPLYGQSRKKDSISDNYLYPLFSVTHGEGLHGWQFWPFVGREHKDPTTRTNGFGDIEIIGGYDDRFVLWPFFLRRDAGYGTDDQSTTRASLPFFSYERSPGRDSTTVLWPLFSHIVDRDRAYREWQLPWPIIEFARGPGKTATRVWPFYSHAQDTNLESAFYCWPFYKYNRIRSAPLDRRRTRILFFLYSDTIDVNTETGKTRRRTDFMPFCNDRREADGSTRLQVFSPLEPFAPYSRSIEQEYSPMWSVWLSQRNARTGVRSEALLWNLYRHEAGPRYRKFSFLLGLIQYQAGVEGKRLRLLYLPVFHTRPAGKSPPAQAAAKPTTDLSFGGAKLK
jgi:hypothetical protein